ncbi:hypothetical protein HK102_012869 [Quaeritorhiza haematococci]|nr:hypothetical protein HK102_012869 [Quaeritorhiza haematococci]
MLPRLFPTSEEWLAALLRRDARKGFLPNVTLADTVELPTEGLAEGERPIALLKTDEGRELLLTGVRLMECGRTVFLYDEVVRCHWMTDQHPVDDVRALKEAYWHRLILDLTRGRKVVLKELGQAAFPLLRFFDSIAPPREASRKPDDKMVGIVRNWICRALGREAED